MGPRTPEIIASFQNREQDDRRESRETIRVFAARDDRSRRLPVGGEDVPLHHTGHCARQRAADAASAAVYIGGQIGSVESSVVADVCSEDVVQTRKVAEITGHQGRQERRQRHESVDPADDVDIQNI